MKFASQQGSILNRNGSLEKCARGMRVTDTCFVFPEDAQAWISGLEKTYCT